MLALLVAVSAPAGVARAQGFVSGLGPEQRARLADPSGVEQALAAAPGRPLRVIVEFDIPELPAGVRAGSARDDVLTTAAVRAGQDAILGRVGLVFPDEREGAADAVRLRRMTTSAMFALDATPELLGRLAADPGVRMVHVDRLSRPLLTQSLSRIGMPAAYAAGATGQGQVVAVLDSGARLSHQFLASRIVAGACFNTVSGGSISRCPGGVSRATTRASSEDCTATNIFGCGHGTHVAGIAAGFYATPAAGNPAHGVARDARILSINVFARFPASQCGSMPAGYTSCILSYTSDQIAALDHVYSLRNTYRIAAVNMSLGGDRFTASCPNDPLRPAVQRLRSVGIAVIAAAGNDGWTNAVGSPACIPEVIAVGATTATDARASFSNWGTLVNIVAPGSAIRSSYIAGTSNTAYANLSGTSMATPMVAGAFAAMRTIAPNATIDEMLAALRATGTGVTVAGVTIPRINVDRAVQRLRAMRPTTTTVSGPTTAVLGTRVAFTATVRGPTGTTPTGTVSFRRNGVQFATASVGAMGQATAVTYALPAGTHQITAVYLGAGGLSGSTSAARTITVSRPAVPVNDAFARRIIMPAVGGRFAGDNTGATREAGEPAHLGTTQHGRSVWWQFTAPRSGRVTIDTCGSGFDTVLAVYTGSAVGGLRAVASNDDACALQSRVQFNAVAGTMYQIAVAGYQSAFGTIVVNVAY